MIIPNKVDITKDDYILHKDLKFAPVRGSNNTT